MKFSVLTYNIHKGFQHTRRKRVLHWMRDAIAESGADLVFLQEVMGFETAVQASQLEFLADTLWPHSAYGRNSVTTLGHHGNALLSRFPIMRNENIDISSSALERRGILHAEISIPGFGDLHALSLHLGLLEADRRSQVRRVCHRIHRMVHRGTPLIIGGDFNDWRERASPIFMKRLSILEAHQTQTGAHAKTFPVWMPALKLDRIYFRGVKTTGCRALRGSQWTRLSDHLPLQADFELENPASPACSTTASSSSTV